MSAERELRPELRPGERVLWADRPRRGLRVQWSDLYTVPFGLFFLGFAVVWVAAASAFAPMALFGVPFVGMGMYPVAGRFVVDVRQRARAAYAVTDQRSIIVSGLLSRTVTSFDLGSMSDVVLVEKRNGTGAVAFGPQSEMERLETFAAAGAPGFPLVHGRGFRDLARPREAYDALAEARAVARRAG